MAITNFEKITVDLTEKELALVPKMESAFNTVLGDGKPLKSNVLCDKIVDFIYDKFGDDSKYCAVFTGVKLRKWVNYFRTTGAMPIIATSNGYFISKDQEVIKSQIKSLEERASSVKKCANGLKKCLI